MDQNIEVALGEEDSETICPDALLFGGQWHITCYWSPAQWHFRDAYGRSRSQNGCWRRLTD